MSPTKLILAILAIAVGTLDRVEGPPSGAPSVGAAAKGDAQAADQSTLGAKDGPATDGAKEARAPGVDRSPLPPAGATPAAEAGTSSPDIFMLPDAAGRLRQVLGFSYEDFLEAWRGRETASGRTIQPGVVLDSLEVVARADGEQRSQGAAAVDIKLEFQVQTGDWVEAPLELSALVVRQWRIEGGAGDEYVTYDSAKGQYAAWLHGSGGDKRTVALEGQASLAREGRRRRLDLKLPAATVSSIQLAVPGDVDVESPANATVTSDSSGDGSAPKVRIEGVKGDLAVSWGTAEEGGSDVSSGLEATTDMLVTVDARSLSYDASIRLDPSQRPLRRAWVRLPAGASLVAGPNHAEYDVRAVSSAGPAVVNRNDHEVEPSKIVEIRFHVAVTKPTTVRLAAEEPVSPSRPDAGDVGSIDAGGFEVLGSGRQSGAVALRVNEQLHADFETEGRIDQVEPSELPEALAAAAPSAAFAASDAAWKLHIHTTPRQRHVRVAPQYTLHIGPDGATASAQLNYQITGGRMFELKIDLHGWNLADQPIESGGAVDLNETHVTEGGVLVLPLKDPNSQQLRLQLALRRPAGLGHYLLALPEPMIAAVSPGALKLASDSAWQAIPDIEGSNGVSPAGELATADRATAASGEAESPDADSARLETFLPASTLALEVRPREQAISVSSAAEVRVDEQAVAVVQRLDYDVRYQPASELAVSVANGLLANEGLAISVDGETLPSSAVEVAPLAQSLADGGEGRLRLVVRLAHPQIGKIALAIKSQWPLTTNERAGKEPVALLLAAPEQRGRSTASVAVVSSLAATLWPGGTGPWTLRDDPSTPPVDGMPGSIALAQIGANPDDVLQLRLSSARSPQRRAVQIDAAWAQTWIAGGVRQDRYVYRCRVSDWPLQVFMPEGADEEPLETLIDGQVAPADRAPGGSLTLAIPTGPPSAAHTIEFRRQTPLVLGTFDQLTLELPRIDSAKAMAPMYWHLVLPDSCVVLCEPAGLTGEYKIGWQDFHWGRQPTEGQRDLEKWASASEAPLPSSATNQYVFSALNLPERVEVSIARQTWVVIAASLAALLSGLAWLYTNVARSAAFWLAASTAIIALLVVYPEAAIVVTQAAVVAAVFTAIATLLKQLAPQSGAGRAAPSTAVGSVSHRTTTTQLWPRDAKDASVVGAASSVHASGSRT